MEKFYIKTILALAILASTTFMAHASKITINGVNYEYYAYKNNPSKNYAMVAAPASGSTGSYTGDIVIPETITDSNGNICPVTSINQSITAAAKCWFRNVTSISLPAGITIKDNQFLECSKLESVILHPDIKKIGKYAFKKCTALKEIVVPELADHGTNDADGMFAGCTALQTAILLGPGTVSKEMFSGCTSLKKVIINPGIKEIGTGAFKDCTSLQKANGGEGVIFTSEVTSMPSNFNIFPGPWMNIAVNSVELSIPSNIPAATRTAFENATYAKNRQSIFMSNINNSIISGVDEVEAEDADHEAYYYTLQGMRVEGMPTTGIYIKVCAGKATKIYVR